jgi:hypothetical protein
LGAQSASEGDRIDDQEYRTGMSAARSPWDARTAPRVVGQFALVERTGHGHPQLFHQRLKHEVRSFPHSDFGNNGDLIIE